MKVVVTEPIANVEVAEVQGDTLHLGGWVVNRTFPLSHVELWLNGCPLADDVALFDRADVLATLCPEIPHTIRSGFDVTRRLDRAAWFDGANRLDILTRHGAEERGAVTLVLRDLSKEPEHFPMPTQILRVHVGGERDNFLSTGWRIFGDLSRELGRFGGWPAFDRILDWGCGCGRVLRYILEAVPASRVFGCDIDREAVEWLARSATGSSFAVTRPEPPTSYPEDHFDLVYGISILTHLAEGMQDKWLQEIARIAKRSGVVMVTVHGPELAPRGLHRRLKKKGYAEQRSNQASFFAPYANAEYYRTAFHTPEYVERHWAAWFDLLEYVPRGVNMHQDLVIMRKR